MERDELVRLMVQAAHRTDQPLTQIYPASDVRPHDYPAGLPFMPGVYVTITTIDDTVGVNWFMVREPDELLLQLSQLCEDEGWIRQEQNVTRETRYHSLAAHFRNGAAERSITAVTSGMLRMVTMTQTPR